MEKLMPKKLHLSLLFFVCVFSVLALVSYFCFDSFLSGKIYGQGAELDEFYGADVIEILGKCFVPLWCVFIWGFIKKNIKVILSASLALILTLIIISPSKVIFGRQRPNEYFKNQSNIKKGHQLQKVKSYFWGLHKPVDQSFPSGDTATSFAIVTAITPFIPAFGSAMLFFAAAAVGSLRVLALAHYLSDVSAGAAVGILCGWLAGFICDKWLQKAPFPFGPNWRSIAGFGIFLIPLLNVIFKGLTSMRIFLLSSIVLTFYFYIVITIPHLLKNHKDNL